jgi:6-pyruvoyltetrahydropterin/6-carboxytetrahydropterin synthase
VLKGLDGMPYEISTEDTFSAAHYLAGYPGDCSHLHGHNWRVRVAIRAEKSGSTGLTYDFRKLRAVVAEVIRPLDHSLLNELPFFEKQNPTAEVIAEWCYHRISERIDDPAISVSRVEVWESAVNCATFLKG